MIYKIILIIGVSSLYIGCTDNAETTAAQEQSGISNPSSKTSSDARKLSYSIISDKSYNNIKRSVDVRLNSRITKDALGKFAKIIKLGDKNSYQRTFISYYLPGMKVGEGAWATTHFNPDLEVKILGATLNEHEKLVSQSDDPSRTIIGVWLDKRPMIEARVSLYKKNQKVYIEMIYQDGSTSNDEVVERKSGNIIRIVKRFMTSHVRSFGEYWTLDKDGDLKLYDNEGLVIAYIPIRK